MAATSGIVSVLCLVGQGIVLYCDRVFSYCWIQVFIYELCLSFSLYHKDAGILKY